MKISALGLAAALAFAAPAFAATHDGDAGSSSSARSSTHQLAADLKGAMHKLGDATRSMLHKADNSLHRQGKSSS